MGKAKRKSFNKKDGDVSACTPKMTDPEIAELRNARILPFTSKLQSLDAAERAQALEDICDSLDEPQLRNLFLREHIVQYAMERGVHDDNMQVVVKSWKLLRTVAVEDGYGQCLFMYRKDILKPVQVAVDKLVGVVSREANGVKHSKEELEPAWEYADNVVGLLLCLSETNDDIVDAIAQIDPLLPFVLRILASEFVPIFVRETAAQCLYTLTISDPGYPNSVGSLLMANAEAYSILQQASQRNVSSVLMPIAIVGVIHNTASDSRAIATDPESLPLLLSHLDTSTTKMGNSLRPSKEFSNAVLATEIALEIIASMALGAQDGPVYEEEEEGGEDKEEKRPNIKKENTDKDAMEEDKDGDEEMADGGEDGRNEESGDEDDASEDDDDDIDDDILDDMDMVTAGDHDIPNSLPRPAESLFRTLICQVTPGLIKLSSSDVPISVIVRALNALSNISWCMQSALPKTSKLFSTWESAVDNLWAMITAAIASNTADVDLADALASLAWGIARSGHPLDVSQNQHRSFIALYQAATDSALKTKCIGLLGCLAQGSSRIEVNKEIGVFLITLLTSLPNDTTPTESVIEALNALFDIYADEEFDYDAPVFVQCGFLPHLEKAVKGIRSMIKRVDRKKDKELRDRGDEALENLMRFIKYKRGESGKGKKGK